MQFKETAFKYLISENKEKSKTKHIEFETFEMSPYVSQNRKT